MATLIKRGGRKLLTVDSLKVGYADIAMPGLLKRQHLTIDLGNYVIRLSYSEAQKLVDQINEAQDLYPEK